MATLLRKVWESVSNRSCSTSDSPTHRPTLPTASSATSLGPLFDEIPVDILVRIVSLVGPKDAVKLSCVSRGWRFLVSDNRLWIYFLQNHHHDPWDSVFFSELNLRSDTESAKASRRQLKDAIHTVLFDMNVPAVCAVNQATLALYAAKRTSGIVVNIGFQVTSVVPILHGKVMRKVGVEVIGLGALKLTGFLRELMQQNNVNFESLYTVRTLKENLCYVAADYKTELSKDTQASLEVPAEGRFTLSKERFQTGEILFQPRIAGV
ncbi:hypothetical protein COLO4_07785 [Corchorus olitorius]|uniref:F-box domain-containing protein n=1 Tax=Corchorus olitorius TaxID=93759 RepID=A0A1R3KIJ8_9ROSI|nr:hypothetical protein COLO4_07785 [Corchorus olitorius]